MEIQRTANAGVLLKLDGVSILLDGLCCCVEPYMQTPAHIVSEIFQDPPDLLAFTHGHADHFGETLVSEYGKQNLRPILGPESLPWGTDHRKTRIGDVTVTPIPTRHLGKTEPGLEHVSFLIEGSRRVLFAGDAAPGQLWSREDLGNIDVLIAPYAYANTDASWKHSCQFAKVTVLLHLPEREKDTFGLWRQVETVAAGEIGKRLLIPQMGEKIVF